ncbi:hypothetical protein STRIP9103_03606, partial [Streptomyces ipomoeae 91-03]
MTAATQSPGAEWLRRIAARPVARRVGLS